MLQLVEPGADRFLTEKYQLGVAAILNAWKDELLNSTQKAPTLEKAAGSHFSAASPEPIAREIIHGGSGIEVWRMKFADSLSLDSQTFLEQLRRSLDSFSSVVTAEFQVTHLHGVRSPASNRFTALETHIRYEIVGAAKSYYREQRIGEWEITWDLTDREDLRLRTWRVLRETRSRSLSPIFSDVTAQAFAGVSSLSDQLAHGSDYWRSLIDGASGIDIYGHNGLSLADIDGNGQDDLYVCQPAGLPNRLYRNRGDGTFEDVTEASGLGLLENTACALFVDVDNDGTQDAIIVHSDGPVLFLGDGRGRFHRKHDAFKFVDAPRGSFTGAAVADYDRDGWLDVYFCLYSYYQGAGQYRYPTPYFDAENGPPNFMMRNQRDGTFQDVTRESGLDRNNNRFSFCCGWTDFDDDGWPDLYVVNDFGRKNLYRNNGDRTFTDVAAETGTQDIGAGMSACWLDSDRDGRPDLYVGDMWTAAGIRVAEEENFQSDAAEDIRALYRKHAMGNSLFANRGNGHFDDATDRSGTRVGRWSWSSDALDFDHDGFPDLYIANGMISGSAREDLNSFFWRQVVANSPVSARPNDVYEQAWNAINELIRSDGTWSGYERNILYMNNRDGTFSDISGIAGLDFIQDSRTFALADFDHDGRVEIFLKNRNAPQLRLLKNVTPALPRAIAIRLTGKKSNRDAIGAAVTVETKAGRQTQFVQAGSGFLAQHSKELFFGLGDADTPIRVSIRWPSGIVQNLSDLPPNHRVWVEEGSPPSKIEPFAQSSSTKHAADATRAVEEILPASGGTWLLAPLTAPDFSLPDDAGEPHSLSQYSRERLLLYFWSAGLPNAAAELHDLESSYAQWAAAGWNVLVIRTDDGGIPPHKDQRFPFPVVAGSADVLAVYNILFRSIFDRHRDLPLPAAFLVDEKGAIVKVSFGRIGRGQFEEDFRGIPQTAADRLAKALPFRGVIGSSDFVRNNLSLGSVLFERGYANQSESFFALARQDDPSAAEPYYGLGSVYLEQGKNADARQSFERALAARAHYPGTQARAWNNLAIIAAREGQAEDAIQNFERALELDPDFVIALVNLGSAYREEKRWDDAKRVLGTAVRLSPRDPDANYGLAMVFAQLNDVDRAYDYFQKALAARAAYPEALNNLGVLYVRTQRIRDAEKTFHQCISIAPSYDQAYLNLARLYEIERDTERARAVLRDLLKQHPGHVQAQKELDRLTP